MSLLAGILHDGDAPRDLVVDEDRKLRLEFSASVHGRPLPVHVNRAPTRLSMDTASLLLRRTRQRPCKVNSGITLKCVCTEIRWIPRIQQVLSSGLRSREAQQPQCLPRYSHLVVPFTPHLTMLQANTLSAIGHERSTKASSSHALSYHTTSGGTSIIRNHQHCPRSNRHAHTVEDATTTSAWACATTPRRRR